jgi:hypothetical protein
MSETPPETSPTDTPPPAPPGTVVKAWTLNTLAGVPFTLSVMADASLWLVFDNTLAPLDFSVFGPAMSQISDTIAQVVQANSVDPATKTVGTAPNTVTITCDLPYGHASNFHHDPASDTYWMTSTNG